jgi:hypothetical protein
MLVALRSEHERTHAACGEIFKLPRGGIPLDIGWQGLPLGFELGAKRWSPGSRKVGVLVSKTWSYRLCLGFMEEVSGRLPL